MDPLLILLFLILFLLSGFFSGTEIALMSIAKHKLDSLVKSGVYGSASLKSIKEHNDRLLITILIGNNLVNVYTAALATQLAISFSESVSLPQAQAVGIATGIITLLLLLFGEIIPKSFATKNAERISLAVAPLYRWLMIILYPVIMFIEMIIKLFSGKNKVEQMTGEEIESFIDMGRDHGGIDDDEHEKIKSILEFDETTVEEIMTPRVKIDTLSIDSTVQEAVKYYLTHTHTRIPVYTETIDKIDYFISARDLMNEITQGNGDKKLSELTLKKVLKVPLNQSIQKLFETLQNTNKVIAIVMDEYGGVAGLVTMEDIVEEVFGEIRDETDKEVDEFRKIGNDSIICESDMLIDDLLDECNLEFEQIGLHEKEFTGETLSYVVTNELGAFPSKNQKIQFSIDNSESKEEKKLQFKVLEIENAKIGKVEVKII